MRDRLPWAHGDRPRGWNRREPFQLILIKNQAELVVDTTPASVARNQPYYAPKAINVRKGPGTNNSVAYKLNPGDITYPGNVDVAGWAPVHSGRAAKDTIGWVLRDLLQPGNPPSLLLTSWNWESEEYGTNFIVGEVKNLSGHTFSYVEITCTLYDGQDRQVGTALDNTVNLEAGAVWRFKALVSADNARKYKCAAPEGA